MTKTILIFIGAFLTFFQSTAKAEPPKEANILGISLGASLDEVFKMLSEKYPNCELDKSIYTIPAKKIKESIIGKFSLEDCNAASSEITDKIEVTFVHSEVDSKQPAYQIALSRFYESPKLLNIKYSLDDIQKSLFEKYGNPISQNRKKYEIAMPVEVLPNGKVRPVKNENTEQYEINYLWAEKGNVSSYCTQSECGLVYLKASVLVAKRKNLYPKNTFFVTSLSLSLVNSELDSKQFEWLYDQKKQERIENLSF